MFRVTNPLGDYIQLDRDLLIFILNSNGIQSELITNSNEDDSGEWVVQISEERKGIIEKNGYLLGGVLNGIELCLHFSPIQGNVDDEEETVLVKDVPNDLDLGFLRTFLENESLSGGGKIQNFRRVANSTDVEVTFENVAVISRVLQKSPLKVNDLTFPIIKKPIVNRASPERASQESEEKTIEVHGIPVDMDLEMVKLYFENHRQSRGGRITGDLIRDGITGIVLITFDSSEDAIQVVKKQGEHVFEGQTFSVNMHQSWKGKQFFLSDVKRGLNNDCIINFLESKTGIWVENIRKESENIWIVYCKEVAIFSEVQQLCKAHTMNFLSETYPKVSPVPACDTILVSSSHHELQALNEVMIQLYFGSHDVKSTRKLSTEQFLVTFKNSSVVPEVCQKSHKIMDTEIQVRPYYKHLLNDGSYEDYVLDSSLKLELMKKYQPTVETMLQPHVKPIWAKSNGQVLKIELSRCSRREEGIATLENVLKNIYMETMSLSTQKLAKAEQFIQRQTPNAIVSLDSINQTLQIVAFGEDTIVRFKEDLTSSGFLTSNESQKIRMDSYKISLLFAQNFPQELENDYPGIHIENGRNEIIIKGNSSNFTEVEREIYKFLNNVQCNSVQLPEHAAFLLKFKPVKDYMAKKLKSKKCIVSWEIKENDSVIVYSMKANQLAIAIDVFKSSIKALDFGTSDPKTDVMKQKNKWGAFLQSVHLNYANLFYLDKQTLTGVTIDREEEKINNEFKDFFKSNVVLEKLVPLQKTQTDYFKKKEMKNIDNFCKEFGTENPVTMTLRPDNQLLIKASEENMEKASTFIEDLIRRFTDMQNYMEYMGVEKKNPASGKKLQTIFQTNYANREINIYLGDMTQLSVDAIVNAANEEMSHGGGVAKAIVDKGGRVIQTESTDILTSRNIKSVRVGDAIITSGGHLPCKHVIHTVGPIWTGGNAKEEDLLLKCVRSALEIADNKSLVSIAFPAISAGSYNYPLKKAVDAMFSSVKGYLDNNSTTSLKAISFVDTRSVVTDAFHSQIMGVFSPPKGDKKGDEKVEKQEKQAQSDPPKPKVTLIIKKGELEKVKADIIVNSISKNLDFSHGKLSTALLQSAGKELQQECKKYTSLGSFKVIVTKGYKLQCNNVFHISLPDCTENAKLFIQKCVEQCLTAAAADNCKASSIAFPSLGTGKLNYPHADVAKVMLKAAYYHLNKKESSLKEVLFIIYPKDTHVFKSFMAESNDLQKHPGVKVNFESSKVTIEMELKESVSKSDGTFFGMKKTPNQSSLQLTSQGVPTPMITTPVCILGSVQLFAINGDLLNEQTDAIVHCTDVKFDLKGAISGCLSRKCGSKFGEDCKKKSSEMTKDHFAVTNAYSLKCQLILHLDIVSNLSEPKKILSTCFSGAERCRLSSLSIPHLATHGKAVPLDEMAAAMVEVLSKFKGTFLKRVNVVLYQSKMVADFKKDVLSVQAGSVLPKKLTKADLLTVTPLQNTDAEYKKVESDFMATLKRRATIKSIGKIKNKPLKIQYEAQIARMTALNPPQTVNERNLWHGTNADVVAKISKDGFDRGYCGINGVAHGQGVYFAVEAQLSDRAEFTPKDTNGYKHMLRCRVGTGVFVQGNPSMKVLPPRKNRPNLRYDSSVNNIANPGAYVIYNDVQAYPAYHITYC